MDQIFEGALTSRFIEMSEINLLIIDECHRTRERSAYAEIFKQFYWIAKVRCFRYHIFPCVRDPCAQETFVFKRPPRTVLSLKQNSPVFSWNEKHNGSTVFHSTEELDGQWDTKCGALQSKVWHYDSTSPSDLKGMVCFWYGEIRVLLYDPALSWAGKRNRVFSISTEDLHAQRCSYLT